MSIIQTIKQQGYCGVFQSLKQSEWLICLGLIAGGIGAHLSSWWVFTTAEWWFKLQQQRPVFIVMRGHVSQYAAVAHWCAFHCLGQQQTLQESWITCRSVWKKLKSEMFWSEQTFPGPISVLWWKKKKRVGSYGNDFSCDRNRKLLQTRKQWQPQFGCCSVGSFISTGQHFLIKGRAKNSTKAFSLFLTGFGKS